ncbi:MAG: hypothetical protein ACRD5H_17875, partial [Nitrososphaerales archaeon]
MSNSERHFHTKAARLIQRAKQKSVLISWKELTNFEWYRACKVEMYDTNIAVSSRLGVAVSKYPLNWWASTDGYHGIAFASRSNTV